jgi:hypothetical protein
MRQAKSACPIAISNAQLSQSTTPAIAPAPGVNHHGRYGVFTDATVGAGDRSVYGDLGIGVIRRMLVTLGRIHGH